MSHPRASVPLVLLGLLVLARVALSIWWLTVDEGVLDTESGRHLQRAWDGYSAMGARPFALFEESTDYPPLLYLVGALGALLGGLNQDAFVTAQAIIFIPALAIGCYGAATVAYGPTAGVVAAVFALGAPMAVSVFQMFLIDTTEAAMVAVAVWAILASRRFARTGVAALAGLAVGLGMLSKQNFPLFVVGLIVAVLLRGGWRNWRGLLAFGGVALLVALTWYWSEVTRTLDLVQGASGTPSGTAAPGGAQPERWTLKNLAWYVWSTLNQSVMLPLALAALAGAVALLVRWTRRRGDEDVTPELLAGGLVAYLCLTWITLKDPRYALPTLPYLAVLAAGGVTLLPVRWRAVGAATIAVVAIVNVVGTFGAYGSGVRVSLLPDAPQSGLGERQATLYAPGGWISGPPDRTGAVPTVLRAAAADRSISAVVFDPGAQQPNFNHPGLDIRAREAGLPIAIPHDPGDRRQVVLSNRNPPLEHQPACAVAPGGAGIYLSRGPVDGPFEDRTFYCPDIGAAR